MEIIKALGFVDRRGYRQGTRADRGMGGPDGVVASKMMRVDDFLQRHMGICYVLIAVGVLGLLV